MNNNLKNKTILLIFPIRGLGEKICKKYLQHEAKVLALIEGEEIFSRFLNVSQEKNRSFELLKFEGNAKQFWENLPPL